MSARDTLACTTFKTLWVSPSGQAVWATNVLGHDNADAILSALDKAGYAVVSTGAIHKALQDAFQMGGIEAVQTLEDPNKFIARKHRYADAALAALRAAAEDGK